jgi:iron(III) transport system permease protein
MMGTLAISALVATPILFVLGNLWVNSGEVWRHLSTTVLPTYLINSFWLMLGVAVGVVGLGVSTAWLVTLCRFPASRLFAWALLLPLAAPAYLLAYTYTEFLAFYGPVQTQLRQLMGWETMQDYWFPNVRSLPGAIVMLVLVLYPYVYLLARTAFLSQSECTLEASRNLGCSPWRSFWTVALPLARPAIVAGLVLALMETLNDYGTVQYFGVDTFTTGIYRTWFGMGEQPAAAQLAALLLVFALVLIGLEQGSRGQTRYYQTASSTQVLTPYPLQGLRAIAAFMLCLLAVGLGFLLPGGILVQMVVENRDQIFDEQFWTFATNSLILSGISATLAVLLAVILSYGTRQHPSKLMRFAVQVAAMGYAIPGSVIAVGVLLPIGQLDNAIANWMQSTWGISTGLLLSGTIVALVFAYLVRFLAVSFSTVDASLLKIKPNLDEAARSLGHGTLSTLARIHLPMITPGLLTAAVLVFVDVMKELPMTLIIRPFNFDTLAVRVYNLASDERLAEAAAPALAIVLVGLIPVMLLSVRMSRFRAPQR